MKERSETPEEILVRYADGPLQLETALRDLAEGDLDQVPSAGSWSIRQIVHHLADGDDLWKLCIKMALGNSEGLFALQWYWEKEQMEWSRNWNYAGRDIASSLALLQANRRHIVELVQPIVKTWEKSVRLQRPHMPDERITIGDVIKMQAEHVVGHIQDIQTIRLAYKI
jgi:hypothetical protein